MIEKTLAHRLQRERQVWEFWQSGVSVAGTLNRLYENETPKLLSLTRQNVAQHLRKLGLKPPRPSLPAQGSIPRREKTEGDDL